VGRLVTVAAATSVLPASCRKAHLPAPLQPFCRQDADSTLETDSVVL